MIERPAIRAGLCFLARSCACSAAFILAGVEPSLADGWTGTAGEVGKPRVGYAQGDVFTAMMLTCEGVAPGEVEIVFGGIAAGLPTDTDYPVVVSIDGLAHVLRGRLRANDRAGDNDLVRVAPLAEAMPMIASLKAGRRVEISTPSSRYTLGLGGSGKALAMLEKGCG